jgi:hypothetical protein
MPTTPFNQPPCPDRNGRCACLRFGRELTPQEYQVCPYRCRELTATGTGVKRHQCDFTPERDAITFGFPGNSSRQRYA